MLSKFLLVTLSSVLLSSVAWGQSLVLEGHVFNQRTGVPLESVEIVVLREGSTVARPVDTDANGFYSIELPEARADGRLEIVATCRVRKNDRTRVVANGFTHPATLVELVTRRDLYLPVSGKRSFSRCNKQFSTQ